jgi:hypothetical protein
MPREGVSFDNNYIVKLNISKLLIIIIYSRIWNIIKPKAWMRIENRLMFTSSGAGPGFQVKGRTFLGGGISCEKSRFYAKKSYFLQF